ncbi:uncharacterized protein LOC123410902 [Hordeum vulgare subsp. vulgare]|nr:uncharacterized protein LOC123410902 [Hordeum vulgare subsp. vulgare]
MDEPIAVSNGQNLIKPDIHSAMELALVQLTDSGSPSSAADRPKGWAAPSIAANRVGLETQLGRVRSGPVLVEPNKFHSPPPTQDLAATGSIPLPPARAPADAFPSFLHFPLPKSASTTYLAATMPAAPPPALPEELVEEVLLRIPPDEPARLLRASLVCKSWSQTVSNRGFRRRLRELHQAPPVLGFLHDWDDEDIPEFIPATASPFSPASPVPDSSLWQAIDCRHGRALFLSKGPYAEELLVWEPITGAQQHVPVPVAFSETGRTTAAVFCTIDGCDHCNCHEGPFSVVLVFSVDNGDPDYEDVLTSACVYSSETGAWGELTVMQDRFYMHFMYYSSVLVGKSLLYFMTDGGLIVEYDMAMHGLTWFNAPDSCYSKKIPSCNLMLAEDGGLGLVEELDPHLQLWSREMTDARWIPSRIIYLGSLSLNGAPAGAATPVHVLGFAEGANTIVMTRAAGLFMIQVQSEQMTRVCDDHGYGNLIPVVGFYTPVPRVAEAEA